MEQVATCHRLLRRAFAVALCVLLAVAFVPFNMRSASADEENIKTVKVGWLLNNQGFQSGVPGEYLSGWGYEYLQTLSYYTPGWKYEYVTGTFSELMEKLEAGEIDLMPNISYTDERAEKMLFSSNPEGMEHYYIYTKPDSYQLTTGNPSSLEGAVIGCNRGVMQTDAGIAWLESEGVSCTYRYYDSGDELFAALSSGDVDAIIMNDTLSSEDAMPIFNVGESSYYFVTPKSRSDLMDDINAAMAALQSANPRYNDEVKTRYSVNGSGSSSLTQMEREWLDARGNTITLGYLDGKLPYSDQGSDGNMEGALASLVETLRDKFGVSVRSVAFDSNAAMAAALKQGQIDAAMPVCKDYWLAEQDGSVQSSTLSSTSLIALYSGNTLEDSLKSIAYQPTSLFNGNAVAVRYPDSELTSCNTIEECVDAVKSGRAKSMIIAVTGLGDLRDVVDISDLKTAELSDGIELTCWMNQGNPQLLSIVNKAIANSEASIESGVQSLYNYSEGKSPFVQFLEKYQVPIVLVVLLLMVGVIAVLTWALRKAKSAQAQAQAANAAKTAFLARMSHDIRTPLNGILGLIEIDELSPYDIEAMKANRAKAKVAANHLLTLINDILEMSKIEDRQIVLENKPLNLLDLFRDVYVLGEIRASERGVTISTDGGKNIEYPNVYGSPVHVRRIMLNLVDNCIKYNKPGGKVECSCTMQEVKGNRVTYRFVVSDTGIGMSKEFMEHIFEPFSQANDDARSTFQGTGMGMPIVKALVEKMGGSIKVESELGIGSSFIITVPFIIDRDPDSHKRTVREVPSDALANLNILLAEDNELNTEVAKTLLAKEGAQVACARNGKEAVDLFCSKAPGTFDAILMDIMMPEMDGYEAARTIRRSDKRDAATVPIIAMTANAFAEDAKAAKEAGMNAHISKPIDLDVLKRVLYEHCGEHAGL